MWKIGWGSCVKLAVTILFLFIIIHYWDLFFSVLYLLLGASIPLMIGFAAAYIVNILMSVYERWYTRLIHRSTLLRFRRFLCMSLSFLSVGLVALLLWNMIIPVLLDCLYTLADQLPQILEDLTLWLRTNSGLCCKFLEKLGFMEDDTINWEEMVTSVIESMFLSASTTMQSLMSVIIAIITTAVTFILALAFAVYILMRKERLKCDCRRLMEKKLEQTSIERIFYILDVINHAFRSFIIGQCIEAVILGLLCIAGMWILKLPYPVMIGCLVGFTALIPLGGAYIGAVVGSLMIFAISPWKALLFLLFLTILQQIEGNLIYPRVVGSSMGLPGIWVLAAVIIGGSLAGILGMLIAVPSAAAIYRLFHEWLDRDSA